MPPDALGQGKTAVFSQPSHLSHPSADDSLKKLLRFSRLLRVKGNAPSINRNVAQASVGENWDVSKE
ncbi:MAG TPA: hypothetical protein VMF06_21385 [Candidatus Limnocylindria bacterium]|nr:hypothetical protein [Candidatus Limnocylindria bacterium]